MNYGVLVGFIVYLVILAYIGWWANRYTKTTAQYFVGGRKIKILGAALSDKASDMSGWLMLGYPGQAFSAGIGALWAAIGCLGSTLGNYILTGPRLRIYAGKFRAITIPDYLEARLKDNTKLIRVLSAAFILIFMTGYVTAQFAAGGKVFGESFGVSTNTGIVITMIILTAYVIVGGFFAVVWTDVVQALFMLLALIAMPFVIVYNVGGFDHAIELINSADPARLSPIGGLTGAAAVVFVVGYFAWFVNQWGYPHILTRYMSVEDPRKLRRPGIFISTIWEILVLWSAFFAGFLGFALYTSGALDISDPEKIVPSVALAYLPPWLAGFIMAGIISAVMSTADSQLLVAASAVENDIVERIFKVKLSQKSRVNISRIVVLVLALFAMFSAISGSKFVYGMVAAAAGGLAVGFAPIMVLSLWWKRLTKWGGIAGMAYGLVSEIILEKFIYGWAFNPNAPGVFGSIGAALDGIPVYFINFFITLIVMIIVSLLTKPPEEIEKLHKELFTKVPIHKQKDLKNAYEARAQSQIENVVSYIVTSGLLP